ncbi:MAG: response regulator [Chitinophagales bacterium]
MKSRVLIVDDSDMIRNFHSYILQNAGFKITTAIDGADALEKIYTSDEPWNMIITDINMPNMDGYVFIERLREDPNYENTPVIIISTEDELKDKNKGFEVGANLYIVKPTDPDVLLENIYMLLGE